MGSLYRRHRQQPISRTSFYFSKIPPPPLSSATGKHPGLHPTSAIIDNLNHKKFEPCVYVKLNIQFFTSAKIYFIFPILIPPRSNSPSSIYCQQKCRLAEQTGKIISNSSGSTQWWNLLIHLTPHEKLWLFPCFHKNLIMQLISNLTPPQP